MNPYKGRGESYIKSCSKSPFFQEEKKYIEWVK